MTLDACASFGSCSGAYSRLAPSASLETLAVAHSLEPCKYILGHERPVPGPPAVEQKFGEQRGKRLTSLILEASARCERLVHRLAAAECGQRAPRVSAGMRTERILCVGDLTQELVGSFLAAERAMGMTLWVSAGGDGLPAFEHASQSRCLRCATEGAD